MMANSSDKFRAGLEKLHGLSRRPVFYILLASIIEVGSSIRTCLPQSQCYYANAFAVALGTISGLVCIVLIFIMHRMTSQQLRWVALSFIIWWLIGGMIVTFGPPFVALGNGYFSVAFAIIASSVWFQSCEGNFSDMFGKTSQSASAQAGTVPGAQKQGATTI